MKRPIVSRIAIYACIAAICTADFAATNAAAATADYCHNYRIAGKKVSAAKLSDAQRKARDKWSAKAVSVKGSRWGDWGIALDKEYMCGRAGLYYCQAKAAPCLYRKARETKNAYPNQTKKIN